MDEEQKYYTIILRHDTSTQWAVNNPILYLGEYGVEDDTHRVKRGDGETTWNELKYEDFGLTYLMTFENLSGELSDNETLTEEFDKKLSKEVLSDVNYNVISGLTIEAEDGAIGKISKISKNINTAGTSKGLLLIKSKDQSIQGYWSIDDEGTRILDLRAESTVSEYEAGMRYFTDYLCFHNNRLYRALENFVAEDDFVESHWAVIASLKSSDIKYDNKISKLEATDVKNAIDELADLDSEKLKMTRRPYKVYGTNEDGDQILYDKDELRTVDTVNGVEADDNKNIQIDASDINYADNAEEPKTIKEILDSKVDKTVAGAKIVRDVKIKYNEERGNIELLEDKVSLEDGSSSEETSSVDVVSETELLNAKNELNTRIDTEVETLNGTISDEVLELNERIDKEVDTLDTRIDTEVETLNNTIVEKDTATNEKFDTEVERLDDLIVEKDTATNEKFDAEVERLDGVIDTNKTLVNSRIDTEVANLNNTITSNKADIEEKLRNAQDELNETIDNNKSDIEQKLNSGLNTKIDKNIADNLVAGIEVATVGKEPTLKVTSKNTSSKEPIYDYIHFVANGEIKTYTRDEDHLVIDSTAIDEKVADNIDHLSRIDEEMLAVETHLTNHDKALTNHDTQIALHETHLSNLDDEQEVQNSHLIDIDNNIINLTNKHNNDVTDIKAVNASQELHLTRIDGQLDTHTKQLQAQSDKIVEVAEIVSSNLDKINDLTENKIDKSFANTIDNQLGGGVSYSAPANNTLMKFTEHLISPVDYSNSTKQFEVKSSDNTIVAKALTDSDGNLTGVDLATNLDTDVNYFVTTQILNTTVPSENTVELSSLTATDKTEVEVQDIISDTEGTWSRVKSIDKEAGTCVTVTYAKHAQAVWGTVKGDIADQQDLQDELDKKFTIPNSSRTYISNDYFQMTSGEHAVQFRGETWNTSAGIMYYYYDFATNTMKSAARYFAKEKLDNYDILFKEYLDKYGKHTQMTVNAEAVYFDPKDSGLVSTKLSASIRELKALDDEKVLITDLDTYKQEVQTALNTKVDKSLTSSIVANVISQTGAIGDKNTVGLYYNYYNPNTAERSNTCIVGIIPDNTSSIMLNKVNSGVMYGDVAYSFTVQSENVVFDPQESGLVSTKLAPAIRELKALDDEKVLISDFNTYKSEMEIEISNLNDKVDNIRPSIVPYAQGTTFYSGDLIAVINPEEFLIYAGVCVEDYVSDKTKENLLKSFIADVEAGKIIRIGIPAETDTPVVNKLKLIISDENGVVNFSTGDTLNVSYYTNQDNTSTATVSFSLISGIRNYTVILDKECYGIASVGNILNSEGQNKTYTMMGNVEQIVEGNVTTTEVTAIYEAN